MTYRDSGAGGLDYFPCNYGTSKLMLRGPRRRLQGEYIAFLGGTETYGRFLPMPYPSLFEAATRTRAVNLGCINAGPDVYLNDPALLDVCRGAHLTVIEVMGAANLSNRFYRVHPRRNDRFLRATRLLHAAYPGMDFTEFNFTRHLLHALRERSPAAFDELRTELKRAWVEGMLKLIRGIGGPVALLWMADRAPEDGDGREAEPSDRAPYLVDRGMLSRVGRLAGTTVEVVAAAQEIRGGRAEMLFDLSDAAAAHRMLGPVVHRRVAETLARDLAAPVAPA